MKDSDEIRSIMREALELMKDQALAEMSTKDQRVVSIAQRPTEDEVRRRIASVRHRLLTWPLVQALLGCLAVVVVCLCGVVASLSGESLGQGAILLAILGVAAIPFPAALMLMTSRG